MKISTLLAAAVLAALAPALRADVTPASPFTAHMVLQQGLKTAIFGTATPGEQVSVSLDRQTQTATADDKGKWVIYLKDLKAGGPYALAFEGKNKVTLDDVYVGEVWLCSGQSNMDFTVVNTPKYRFAGVANMEEEVKNANYPTIRMFSGEWQKAYEPQAIIKGVWKPVTPENVKEMSAIGYFFARDLQKQLNVPIGIVTETFGASCAEAWVSREALAAQSEFKPWLDTFDKAYATFKQAGSGKDPSQDQHNPTVMYNGMIAPILPFTFKGVLWYQGESIAKPLATFPLVNETLIKDWRARFENPELPFYVCQLAGQAANSNRPEVREAQAEVLKIPHTGMVVTTDIGEEKNVHPKNKQDVGARLVKVALANTYGKPIEFSGPMFESAAPEGAAMRVKFSHAKELVAKTKTGDFSTSEPLNEFTIAGADGKFVPATAKIDGTSVLVSSPAVPEPKAVRYAWTNYPITANLYNSDRLPAAQFRSDGPAK